MVTEGRDYPLLTELTQDTMEHGLFGVVDENVDISFDDNGELSTARIRITGVRRVAEGIGRYNVLGLSIAPPDKIVEIEVDPLQLNGEYGTIRFIDPVQ